MTFSHLIFLITSISIALASGCDHFSSKDDEDHSNNRNSFGWQCTPSNMFSPLPDYYQETHSNDYMEGTWYNNPKGSYYIKRSKENRNPESNDQNREISFQTESTFNREANFGSTVGNGGDVVVCRDPITKEINDIALLDFYEAEVRGLKFDPMYEDMNTLDVVNNWLNESAFSRLDNYRAEKYREWTSTFLDEVIWLPDGTVLEEIDDSEHVHVPHGCNVEQLIVQKPVGRHRYYIKKEFWDLLEEKGRKFHQAGAILHEIVYREAIGLDHKNSFNSRYLTGSIASTFLDDIDQEAYAAMLRSLNFPSIEVFDGHQFVLGTVRISETKVAGTLWQPTSYYFLGKDLPTTGEKPQNILYEGEIVLSKEKRRNEVDEFHVVLEGTLAEDLTFFFDGHCSLHRNEVKAKKGDVIKFDKLGSPISLNDVDAF